MYEAQTAVLHCPCREFPPTEDPTLLMTAYQEARKRAGWKASAPPSGVLRRFFRKAPEPPAPDSFVPVLIAVGEDSPLEDWNWPEGETPEKRRERLLSQPVEDGGAVLARLIARNREAAGPNGWPAKEVLGPVEGSEPADLFLGISDFQGKTIPLVLAELPVRHPWEVFACVPFGGWNACPRGEEQMAVAKYWYEKYGAVPAVITRDVLEYDLPAPVRREQAMELAMEQYAFCPDIVDQGCESVGYLADSVATSTKWYFWWD